MTDGLSKAASMSGLAGLGAMYNVGKGAFQGKSVGEITKGLAQGIASRGRNGGRNDSGDGSEDAAKEAAVKDHSAKKCLRCLK